MNVEALFVFSDAAWSAVRSEETLIDGFGVDPFSQKHSPSLFI